jgi:hypothetical protein
MANLASNVVSANLTPLSLLQTEFCLIKLGGAVLIVDRGEVALVLVGKKLGPIAFYKKADGEVLMKRYLENLPMQCDVKKTLTDFWVSPYTHVYIDIAFSPKVLPATTLNYWVGHLIQPVLGDWSPIKYHLLSVICSNDEGLYNYLINYMAHMIQYPEQKPGVMVTLLGRQGTGKGLFFEVLRRIWPVTTLLVSDINQIIGQFNAVLGHTYVVIMDEAMFSGDRKSQDRMKSLITEKTCQIEQKHQPSRTIESVHRFFASSNHDHFSHVESDDRRALFIRVSDSRQGDSNYFSHLANAIDDDAVIAAMIFELKAIDLTNFKVRCRPITAEHSAQKLRSLQGFDRYWFEVLTTGYFGCGQYSTNPWRLGDFIATRTMHKECIEYDKRAQRYASLQTSEISRALGRLCSSAKASRKTVQNSQHRGYVLPALSVARQEFEEAYNCKVDWGEVAPAEDLDFVEKSKIKAMLATVSITSSLNQQ